jgi:hypothetical protein
MAFDELRQEYTGAPLHKKDWCIETEVARRRVVKRVSVRGVWLDMLFV